MRTSDPTRRAPRSEEERLLRGRLVGRSVQLLDGRSGILRSVWYDPTAGGLSCCVQLQGATTWIDASEIRITPGGSAA
jgi:hypothetical protein